jgi:cytoplasmic iron level regulating protein YaaA (DUF328/UPF0246 family)
MLFAEIQKIELFEEKFIGLKRKNFVTQRTRAHMLRKIAQSSVSRHAQMRNALANGSMVRV